MTQMRSLRKAKGSLQKRTLRIAPKLASQRKCDPKLISTPNTHGLEPSVSDLVGGEAFAVDASIIVADAHIAQGHSVAATLHARMESL